MSAAATYMCRQFVEDVTAYPEGALSDVVVARIESHLADCPHCREYLTEMRLTVIKIRALDDADVHAMPDDVRDRLMRAFDEHSE